ncbi:family 10 glycosylhydrolase [Paenibacillus sp. ACRRX]|uniref:family 10 glycosylhydrolase n=1 Tax=Paenibacillus sp. ACRRX TaxID=2918206 RepID=UPI001EF44261|nr:family 10 glycosylhydrolase [Paenibacillus sp. ACRRX]MCG7406283.1 family 10 glycosylhydrolase [Paenibacillus sp. ACRRX]
MNKWKHKLVAIIGVVTICAAVMPTAYAQVKEEIKIFVDSKRLVSDVAPYLVPGKNVTMLPFRAIGEGLGADVTWNPSTRGVEFKKADKTIKLTLGEKRALVNGTNVSLEVGAEMKGGRTMVPLRFIGESLGVQVNWDPLLQTVSLVTGEGVEQPAAGLRATWISSVYNIDWPSDPRKGYDKVKQQQDFTTMLDQLQQMGLNAIFVQVRPTADSFYPSKLLPWSEWLTGKQGQDPGYDPLAFMIEETHKRGMKFHAWFNPYRISVQTDLNKLVTDHPARQHPDWVVKHKNTLLFDPGVPAARSFIMESVMEVVNNYDVDGVHFDDYFYPYGQEAEPFKDDASYRTYNKVYNNKEEWRRNNVNQFVQTMDSKIHSAKPNILFGISPFGVWRNASVDPTGSNTNAGVTSYDSLSADVRNWIQNGWIDYVAPQIYWHIGHKAASYDTLVQWWVKETEGTGVDLYIGHAAYKLADANGKDWANADVLIKQLKYNEQFSSVAGDIYFSAKDLIRNTKQVGDSLKQYYEDQEK